MSGSFDSQDSDGEPNELDEQSDREDQLIGRDSLFTEEKRNGNRFGGNETKRVKVENWIVDEKVYAFDDPIRGGQRRVARERRTDKDLASSIIRFSSDEQAGELPPESSTVTNLKLVYDVEYRAPH